MNDLSLCQNLIFFIFGCKHSRKYVRHIKFDCNLHQCDAVIHNEKSPSFLMVLTAVGGAYQREDGVFVVPINLLKP